MPQKIIGLDISAGMLEVGVKKSEKNYLIQLNGIGIQKTCL
jgi:ubiquinone/menaquinone biosynthesis C-methylase UbiE